MSTLEASSGLGRAPRVATRRPQPLRAEIGRLRHRRLVLTILALAALALLAALTIVFFTHSADVAGARADAVQQAEIHGVELGRVTEGGGHDCSAAPVRPSRSRSFARHLPRVGPTLPWRIPSVLAITP
jgi:hypothetical protein